MKLGLLICGMGFLFLPGLAGEDPDDIFEPARVEAGERGEALFTGAKEVGRGPGLMVFTYVAILGVGGYLFFHQWKQRRMGPVGGKSGQRLNLLETRMLGNKQFLVVAEYDDRRMLLGVGPGFINHLCFLEGKEGGAVRSKEDREVPTGFVLSGNEETSR